MGIGEPAAPPRQKMIYAPASQVFGETLFSRCGDGRCKVEGPLLHAKLDPHRCNVSPLPPCGAKNLKIAASE